jgi:hypothetical protein
LLLKSVKKIQVQLQSDKCNGHFTCSRPVYCVLCAVYCAVYCVLCTVYCVLCTVCCVLCAVYCVLCAVYCVLYMYDNILLNSFWVEKYFRENQNTHLMLHRFFPETVAFIELLQEIQQSERGQRNSCLPEEFVMLHHYHLRSTVYICTVNKPTQYTHMDTFTFVFHELDRGMLVLFLSGTREFSPLHSIQFNPGDPAVLSFSGYY